MDFLIGTWLWFEGCFVLVVAIKATNHSVKCRLILRRSGTDGIWPLEWKGCNLWGFQNSEINLYVDNHWILILLLGNVPLWCTFIIISLIVEDKFKSVHIGLHPYDHDGSTTQKCSMTFHGESCKSKILYSSLRYRLIITLHHPHPPILALKLLNNLDKNLNIYLTRVNKTHEKRYFRSG